MTLSKLSMRNAKRQAGDYLIYFATIIMAAALLYAFHGLIFSQEIMELSRSMALLPTMVIMASIVVVCIFGWLVSYAANFMLTRRSRELGLYILIGLENRQVARLFFQENLAVGGWALAMGILLGNLLFQILRAVVLTLFGQLYRFTFVFSLKAVGVTALYFVLIYLYALKRSRKKIRTFKICELIYYDRKNEEEVIHTGRKRRWIFGLSIVLGAVGTVLLLAGDVFIGVLGALCVIMFLYGFFLSFASGVPAFFDKHPGKKYKGQNLLVFRTLTAKLGTMGITMATISLLFTATLISEGAGLVFHGLFKGRAAEKACFDLYVASEREGELSEEYMDYMKENIAVEDSVLYNIYLGEDARFMDHIESHIVYYQYSYNQDPLMRYSDYAALRSLAGYAPTELSQEGYLIHSMVYLEEVLKGGLGATVIGGASLEFEGIHTEYFMQSYGTGNGHGYFLVVPDEVAESCPIHHRALAVRTTAPVTEEQYDALCAIRDSLELRDKMYDQVTSKAAEEAEAAAMTAVGVFPLYFLALALIMTTATILAIQQLAETQRYRTQFELLRKLGMDRKEMGKALRTQFALYYTMPVLPSIVISVPFILNLAKSPEPGVMVGMSSPEVIVCIALAVFFLIYAMYILIAYTGLKRNVLPEI